MQRTPFPAVAAAAPASVAAASAAAASAVAAAASAAAVPAADGGGRDDADARDDVPRIAAAAAADVVDGTVRVDAAKSLWLAAMALAAGLGGVLAFSWPAFAVFVVSTALVLLLGHSVGLHRKLIHGSFECPRWLERGLVYCGTLTGISGPIELLRTHDLRDFAQRQAACHDYFAHRRAFFVDAAWQLGCRLELRRAPRIAVEPRIASDPFYRFLERTWRWQQLPWAAVLLALGGWDFVFWGVCARVVACNLGHWGVGHFAHRRGSMAWRVRGAAVQGYNVRFCALLTMGESWHNNHHAFPGSARLGLAPGQWDPGWWLLRGLEAVGLAWRLRTPADLPPRARLEAAT